MKKVCAISFNSENGDSYIKCIEGTPKTITKQILKEFGDEVPYIFVDNVVTLDGDKEFRLELLKCLRNTKLGSLED